MVRLRNRSSAPFVIHSGIQNTPVNGEIQCLQETVSQAEPDKTQMPDELEKAKTTTVVQDSVIAGDINTGIG
jgi:vancomycin resistance protein YoaR